MATADEWGRDPSVQIMRQIFRHMELAQRALLGNVNISPFDMRLKGWRKTALNSLEQSWAQANHHNMILNEKKIAAIYIHCLARAMGAAGITIPSDSLPHDAEIEMLLRETLQ